MRIWIMTVELHTFHPQIDLFSVPASLLGHPVDSEVFLLATQTTNKSPLPEGRHDFGVGCAPRRRCTCQKTDHGGRSQTVEKQR